MADLEWHLLGEQLPVDHNAGDINFGSQWAWSENHEGGRYAYQYYQDESRAGRFVRFDLSTLTFDMLTPYNAIDIPYVSSISNQVGSTSISIFNTDSSNSEVGDLEFIIAESSDSTTAAGTPSDPTNTFGGSWTKIFEETQASGATGVTTLTIWARLNTQGLVSSVTVAGVGDHISAIWIRLKNHGVSDVSTDLIVGTGNGADTGNATLNGITTTVNNTLILMATASTRDSTSATFSVPTNGNLTELTEELESMTSTGAGGGVQVATGRKLTSGATGNSSVTIAVSDKWRGVQIGIPPGGTPVGDQRIFAASAIVDDKVYLFAGRTDRAGIAVERDLEAKTWIYDTATDTWDADGTTMPTYSYTDVIKNGTTPTFSEDRQQAVAFDLGGLIYVFSGVGSGSNDFENNRTDLYDPVGDDWTQLTDMPVGADLACIVLDGDGIFHSMVGVDETQITDNDDHWYYTPGSDTWTQLSDITDVEHGNTPLQIFEAGGIYVPSTDEIVFTVFQELVDDALFTNRYNVGTDAWAASTNAELFFDDYPTTAFNFLMGDPVVQGRYGGKYFYMSSRHFSEDASGIAYFEFAGGRERAHWGILMSPGG